jgi:hypothetical protein
MVGISDALSGLGLALDYYQGEERYGLAEDANRNSQQMSALQLELAKQMAAYNQADQITPSGDRFYYDEAAGERGVDLTPRSQKLLDTMRMLEQSNVESRQGDTALADSRRAELAAPSPYSANRIISLLTEQGQRGLSEGYKPVIEGISRQLTRTGASGDAALGKIASNYGKDARDNRINAELKGPGQFEALEGARTQRLGNQALQFGAAGANKAGFTDLNASGGALQNALANQNIYSGAVANSGLAGAAKTAGSQVPNLINTYPSYSGLFNGMAGLVAEPTDRDKQKNTGNFI